MLTVRDSDRPFGLPSLFRGGDPRGFFCAFVALWSHRKRAYEEQSAEANIRLRGRRPRDEFERRWIMARGKDSTGIGEN